MLSCLLTVSCLLIATMFMFRYPPLVPPELPRRRRRETRTRSSRTTSCSGTRRRYALFSYSPHFLSFTLICILICIVILICSTTRRWETRTRRWETRTRRRYPLLSSRGQRGRGGCGFEEETNSQIHQKLKRRKSALCRPRKSKWLSLDHIQWLWAISF